MKELIAELNRFKIDDDNRTFNDCRFSEQYWKRITDLYDCSELLELADTRIANIVLKQIDDVPDKVQAFGPSKENVAAIKRDAIRNECLKPIAEWYQVLYDCMNAKLFYCNKLMEIIHPILKEQNAQCDKIDVVGQKLNEEQEAHVENGDSQKVIKGVRGLAEFLGKGTTWTQSLINSGILIAAKAQYRAGRSWCFNKEILEKYLAEHPNFLRDVHCKH